MNRVWDYMMLRVITNWLPWLLTSEVRKTYNRTVNLGIITYEAYQGDEESLEELNLLFSGDEKGQ